MYAKRIHDPNVDHDTDVDAINLAARQHAGLVGWGRCDTM